MTADAIPLIKFLTGAGLGSRRKLADAIKQGRVQVNGITAESFTQTVDPTKDVVLLDGQPARPSPPAHTYLMLNKPAGIVTTASDEMGRQTVFDIIPARYRARQLHAVGRLDKDSTGLLLLTSDGDLTYRITHPRFEHEKEYWVSIDGRLTASEKRKLEQGIGLAGVATYPARVVILDKHPSSYSITIHEGRKRQVRRMFEALGHQVRALKRVRVGTLKLGNLEEGKTRELTAAELLALRSSASIPARHPGTGHEHFGVHHK